MRESSPSTPNPAGRGSPAWDSMRTGLRPPEEAVAHDGNWLPDRDMGAPRNDSLFRGAPTRNFFTLAYPAPLQMRRFYNGRACFCALFVLMYMNPSTLPSLDIPNGRTTQRCVVRTQRSFWPLHSSVSYSRNGELPSTISPVLSRGPKTSPRKRSCL